MKYTQISRVIHVYTIPRKKLLRPNIFCDFNETYWGAINCYHNSRCDTLVVRKTSLSVMTSKGRSNVWYMKVFQTCILCQTLTRSR